jgi:hypothetical protein
MGTAKKIANYPQSVARDFFRARKRNAVQAQFDREFNVDTTGLISLGELDVEGASWVHGTQYGPTSPATFQAIMRALPIDVCDFTFVDFGSGKGAVLLYASAFPFKQILGVEFSSILHQIAESNIAKHPLASTRPVRSIHTDATQFQIPSGPLFAFFNNPFSTMIMETVLGNIHEAVRASPRLLYICTVRVEDLRTLSSGRFLTAVKQGLTEDQLPYRIYVYGE